MQHSVLGVELLVFGFQILEYEVVCGSEGVCVWLPLRLARDLDHVARAVGLDVVALLLEKVVSLHAPVHVAGADHGKPQLALAHLSL